MHPSQIFFVSDPTSEPIRHGRFTRLIILQNLMKQHPFETPRGRPDPAHRGWVGPGPARPARARLSQAGLDRAAVRDSGNASLRAVSAYPCPLRDAACGRPTGRAGKLASLNRSWQSNKGTFCALGMTGIEPMPSQSMVTGHRFRLSPTTLRGRSYSRSFGKLREASGSLH